MASPAAMMAPPNHSLLTFFLMSPQQECQHTGDEEKDGAHDSKRPARLEHGTVLVDVGARLSAIAALSSIIPQDAEIDVDVTGREIGAIGSGNASQLVDASNEGADEGEVDQGDEGCRAPRGGEAEKRGDGPGTGENRNDEQDENEAWS